MKEHNDESQENNSEKISKFSHLNNSSKVIPSSNKKNIYIAGFVVGIVLLIIFLMFSGGNHKKPQQISPEDLAADNNSILQQNAKKLKELQDQNQPSNGAPASSNPISLPFNSDNREMQARRNAPTQMYTSSDSVNDTSPDSSNESASNNTILAGKDPFSDYANSQATDASTVEATKIKHPYYTIAEGEFIQASLITAINSDLPGMISAVVTRPVYAYMGEKPLIPSGSRLIGQYTSMSSNGQASTRVFVIWNRVITPQGISIMINSPGADELGRTGMGADAVDTHFIRIFGSATLISILGYEASTAGVSSYAQPNSANAYQQNIAEALNQTGQTMLSQNLNISPTLNIYQGDTINVFVAHDLDLYNAMAQQSSQDSSTPNFIYQGDHG